jgi:hypothetical protein
VQNVRGKRKRRHQVRKLTLILALVLSINYLHGQSNYKFDCKSDSVAYFKTRQLADFGIQKIMTFYYSFDNGSVPGQYHYIFWQDTLTGHFIKIGCCNQLCIKDTSLKAINDLFNYYEQNRIDTFTEDIKSEISISHDMGYFISVYYPNKTRRYNIRNYQRGIEFQKDVKRPNEKDSKQQKDPRLIWLDKAETFARQFD